MVTSRPTRRVLTAPRKSDRPQPTAAARAKIIGAAPGSHPDPVLLECGRGQVGGLAGGKFV